MSKWRYCILTPKTERLNSKQLIQGLATFTVEIELVLTILAFLNIYRT